MLQVNCLRAVARKGGRRAWLIIRVGFLLSLLSCNAASPTPPVSSATPPGQDSASATSVTVRQLIDGSEKFADQTIRLTGKIVLECPEGCWFFLDDGTGKIYVDLKPAGLTIPQKIGSRITLRGKIKGTGGNLQVLGDDVKFLDEGQ